jgi:hypothetical protein
MSAVIKRRPSKLQVAAGSTSIDDLEGLITTLGVVAALLLTVVFSIQLGIDEQNFGDYRYVVPDNCLHLTNPLATCS